MQTPYEQLLAVIPDHPGQRILHFVDSHTLLSDALATLTRVRDYEYLLLCFDPQQAARLDRHFALSSHIKVKSVTHGQTRYHTQAKLYDYLFIEAAIPDPGDLLRRIYPAIKNGGMVFVLTHDANPQIDTWREEMERHNYVAFSAFDLEKGRRIVSAKKMHGWGG